MKKIAFCNQKGGVAKTTSALNVATYLALLGKKTLLIDLDPQANATSGIGIDKATIEKSIYNVLHEHIRLEEAIHNTDIDNLFVIPSNINLTGAEVELVNVMGREYRLKKALQDMPQQMDFVIMDCPPSLGLLTINGLTAATSIIIPIQCEYYALEGLSQLMQTIKLIKDNLNDKLYIEGVLMTLADFRTNLTKEVIDEVKKYFGEKVYKTIIPRTIKLTEAPGFGKPIALYAPTSPGAEKYENVAKEILGIPIEEDIIEKEVMVNSEDGNGETIG
ncbi:MAG: AAA family ATPase [Candidatus Omnitrophica bacterium]|nr:AAA family ATPase [Candidatus Omnitrophota bacterium]MDD5488715.1 AAA family ATPase [Candidatus Omnitrophota bacterium]